MAQVRQEKLTGFRGGLGKTDACPFGVCRGVRVYGYEGKGREDQKKDLESLHPNPISKCKQKRYLTK